ncbi:MAG TPA: phosphate signaling complex protein PhoU [Acidimicrobiales bacterium]|jgi:phosphate transport system protein|nr:phosphate signaling complex protein PhoU [Acidimicrobiales bacterium]
MSSGERLRLGFHDELDQLRLQVELMGVRVDENLERMRTLLRTGDPTLAAQALEADDDIDAMNLSLTERCYLLLGREAPVATDLRFVVSVLRIVSELERVGDLALRVAKLTPQHALLSTADEAWDVLLTLADESVEVYRSALRAWSTQDLGLATELATQNRGLDLYYERLIRELHELHHTDATRIAMGIFVAGRALERIADHSAIIGARLRYLITGEPGHLAAEVR